MNLTENFNSRLSQAEEEIRELEDRLFKIMQAEDDKSRM